MDIASLLGGGGDKQTYYLLTPPVEVKEGEKLAFSAKSGSGGMGAMMGGSSSTTFILEKSVYGSNQWEQVKDYKDDLTADYQTFEVTDVVGGEYLFRFTAGGGVNIDSVAGFHIDGDAPDLYVTVDSAVVRSINMGAVEADFSKDHQFVAAQLQAQQRIGGSSYVLLRVAGAQQADHLRNLFDRRTLLGGQIAFFYNTFFGPAGASIGYSNRTKKPYFFLNLGYEF
ncbi:MAG: hypothetical protein J6W38_09610 [Prevotella sp.]|nr:hypothetical protein [Prevotella sp.]